MGVYYCVAVAGTPTSRTAPYSTSSVPTAAALPADCENTWFVGADDTCLSIVDALGLSIDDFAEWNSLTVADCSVQSNAYVCVGVTTNLTDLFSGTASPGTSSATAVSSGVTTIPSSTVSLSSSVSATSSVAISTPTPTQAGMVDGCESHTGGVVSKRRS